MAAKTYLIYRRHSRNFFAGFDADGNPIWVDREAARRYTDRVHAEGQAILLARFDNAVQQKPVLSNR